jgi:hypothetical protein
MLPQPRFWENNKEFSFSSFNLKKGNWNGRKGTQGTQRGEPQPNIRLERERMAEGTRQGKKMEAKI